jgi:hypothetical protein
MSGAVILVSLVFFALLFVLIAEIRKTRSIAEKIFDRLAPSPEVHGDTATSTPPKPKDNGGVTVMTADRDELILSRADEDIPPG